MFRLTKNLIPIFTNNAPKRLGQPHQNVILAIQGQRLLSDSGKKYKPYTVKSARIQRQLGLGRTKQS